MPEQQSASREQHPHTRAQDRIQANQRVVGQQDQSQQCKHDRAARGFACQDQVHQPVTFFRLADELDHGSQQSGQEHHSRDQQRPEPRRPRTKQPATCQQGKQRRWHQAAPKIVENFPYRQGR